MELNLADPRRFRRQIAGTTMVAAPFLIVIAELLHARFETDASEQLAAVADNTGRWYTAHVFVLVALALMVPAFFGLVHLLAGNRATLGNLSLVAFVPGLVSLAALVGVELVLWQMAQPAANRTEMVLLAERLNESVGIVVLFLVVLLFPLAWLLVGTGLYLARAVPALAAVLIALSQPIGFAGELAGGPKVLAVAAQVAFAIGLVPVGIRVLRESDAEWEQEIAGPTAATA